MLHRVLTTVFIIITVIFLGGCVHQELELPTIPISSNSATPPTGTVDVSDLNVTPQSNATVVNSNTQNSEIVARIPFPEEEYKQLATSGNATVKGTIYVIDPYGVKIYGKQTRLYLNPVTTYSRQWYQQSYLGGKKMDKADPRLYNYLRFTASDSKGNFAFYGVPPGSYYLIGVVKCGKECGFDATQNIRVAKQITVSDGDTVTVELTKVIH